MLAPTRGEERLHRRAAARFALDADRPAGAVDDPADDGESDAGAVAFRGEKRFEGAPARLAIHADAAVAHFQHVVTPRQFRPGTQPHRGEGDPDFPAGGLGVARVDDQVQQDAGELPFVDQYLPDARRPLVDQLVRRTDRRPQDGEKFFGGVGQTEDGGVRRFGFGEVEEFVRQADAAVGRREDAGDQCAGVRGEFVAQGQQVGVAHHDDEQIAEVVGQARRHLLERFGFVDGREAVAVGAQGGPQFRHLGRLDPQRQQIGDRTGEVAVFGRPLARRADVLVADHADQFGPDEDPRVEHRGDAQRRHTRGREGRRAQVGHRHFGRDRFADGQRGEVRRELGDPEQRAVRMFVLGALVEIRAAEGGVVFHVQPDADALDADGGGRQFAGPRDRADQRRGGGEFGEFEAGRFGRPRGSGWSGVIGRSRMPGSSVSGSRVGSKRSYRASPRESVEILCRVWRKRPNRSLSQSRCTLRWYADRYRTRCPTHGRR